MSASLRDLFAVASLTLAGLLPAMAPALAQSMEDPPAQVARIAEIAGTVSFHAAGSQDWQAAAMNYPLAPGSGVYADARSHAAVDIGGARIYLDGTSDLEITALDPQGVTLSVPQGAVFVHVYPGVSGQSFEIETPRGAARFNQPGQYEVVAGDDQHPMTVSVVEGAAQLVSQTANLSLQAGQRGSLAPDNSAGVDVAQPDDLIRLAQQSEQVYAATAAQAPQYVSPQEPGYQDLARYGAWQQNPQYGRVWVPQVAANWAPYRYGHWAFVAPWGWTWVDDAPWGFTPFHYGRWVQVGPRWAWTPGVAVARPVYAPALVSFFGNLGGVGISIGVGWVPLAPEEVYVPPYRHSARYVHDINVTNVRNVTKIVNVTNNVTVVNYNNYANHGAATRVSGDVMANGRPVGRAFINSPQQQNNQQWEHAKPVNAVPVAPRRNTVARENGPKVVTIPVPQNGKANTGRSVQSQWPQQRQNIAGPTITSRESGKPTAQPNWVSPKPKPAAAPAVSNQPKVFQPKSNGQPVIRYPTANQQPPVPQTLPNAQNNVNRQTRQNALQSTHQPQQNRNDRPSARNTQQQGQNGEAPTGADWKNGQNARAGQSGQNGKPAKQENRQNCASSSSAGCTAAPGQ